MSRNEKSGKQGAAAPAKPANQNPELVHIQAPRSVLLLACFLVPLAILGVGAGGFWLGSRTGQTSAFKALRAYAVQNGPLRNSRTDTFLTQPGPWGVLECTRAEIEIPDEYLSTRMHQADMPHWLFKGYSAGSLSNLFMDAGLSDQEKADLLDATRWDATSAGIRVNPSEKTVLSLSSAARGKVYEVLGEFGENVAQVQTFHWPGESLDDVFAGADLSAETRALVKRLCFRHGKLVMFADLAAVLRQLPTDAEKNRLEKALSRRPTLLAKLLVSPDSDIDALMRYWGHPGAAKDFRPLLEAAARVPEGTKLSILNLLPAWPATRLQSFPLPAPGAQYDCFWTAFNFFKDPPEAPTTDGAYWKRKLGTEYYRVNTDPRYGDLVMLTDPKGTIIHACVFLADDIVYSKNGASPTVPWVLTTIPELLAAYSAELQENASLRTIYYRARGA